MSDKVAVAIHWNYMDGEMEPHEGIGSLLFEPGWVEVDLWRKYQAAERRWRKLKKEVRIQQSEIVDVHFAIARGRPVDELELPVRVANRLHNDGINTVGDLVGRSRRDLLRIPQFGRRSLNEVVEALDDLGLHLRDEE
jgi:DNA-directed RNA polymerase alpha subunit